MTDLNDLMRSGGVRRLTRRDLLRRAGVGASALSASALLAACGVQGETQQEQPAGEDKLTTNKETGELNFANWPGYIDKPPITLEQFEKASGTEVSYKEVINDNNSFYATLREPLSNDQPVQWDIIVVTDWMLAKMASFGYLEELDHSLLPNFDAHAGDLFKDPTYDPGNKHSLTWQAGITGIAWNPELTGREITSVEDLFDPAFAGKVGMFTEMRDTMHLVMLGMGIKPQDCTTEDARAAQQKLLKQQEDGIVRKYYGNDYVAPLAQGDLALCISWSGDVVGKTLGLNSKIRFTVPEEGGMLWTDAMGIPQNAANPIDAHAMMDFVYQPKVAAQIAAEINYITPVPEVRPIFEKSSDPYLRQVASSPLVFTTPEMESQVYSYKNLSPEEEREWNELFNTVLEG
ncbi:MAG: spermidine/putrescine ABC transporter substrate-binding protein [Actinomycetota bacterium]|nr:spermidine/putrescine ABC transporter substrate-binding protein [Actinomycetota bacterium]